MEEEILKIVARQGPFVLMLCYLVFRIDKHLTKVEEVLVEMRNCIHRMAQKV
jgi:hypothetical protein